MKKIILLLILLPSFNVEAQDPTPCPHELIVSIPEEDSDFCNEDGACVFITVADVSNSGLNQVHLAIKNVGTQSTNYFPIDASNESVRIGYCYYPEGTVLEIFATDFETFCETSHFNYTVIGCSTVDNDNDGFTANLDCDDRDNTVYPGAPEICDGKDNDCDGLKDEDSIMETYYWDADLDGYGNSSLTKQDCRPTGRYVLLSGDCNDADPLINPGASEVCGDDIDNNCDGNIDEGCDCPDADSDTVCDADDICPGFDDLADADADGTPDCLDSCPNDANKNEPGDCGCGVADTDSDSDGTLDCNDACPNDPNKIDPGDCGCGVAETDSDADGTPDCIDECPNDPSNTCNNCPDTDNDTVCDADDICPGANDLLDSDRDGTPDCLDNCPNDRNKTEPGLCGCGSSDADKDADGVPDCNDVCPRSPDTDSDFDGVPDCIDICDGENDTIDTDNDGLPDCVDTCPNDATNTCTANTCRAGYFEICHTMKNGNLTTLCVTPAQWERHKNHPGDVIGACIPVAVAKMATNNKTVYSEQLSIYPNPIKSNGLWIKFSSKAYTKKFTASLYDINGRKLAEKVFDSNNEKDDYFWEFDHGTWDKGVFIIEINDGNRTYYKRILKLNN